jgi:hypothetical protein
VRASQSREGTGRQKPFEHEGETSLAATDVDRQPEHGHLDEMQAERPDHMIGAMLLADLHDPPLAFGLRGVDPSLQRGSTLW